MKTADAVTDREPGHGLGASAGAPDGECESEAHTGHPCGSGRESGLDVDEAVRVQPDVGDDPAEQPEQDPDNAEGADQHDVGAVRREGPGVVQARHLDENQREQGRPPRQLLGSRLPEDDGDEQDVDDVVGGGHDLSFPGLLSELGRSGGPGGAAAAAMRSTALSHQVIETSTKSRPKACTRPGPTRPVSRSGRPRSCPGVMAAMVSRSLTAPLGASGSAGEPRRGRPDRRTAASPGPRPAASARPRAHGARPAAPGDPRPSAATAAGISDPPDRRPG